MFSNQSQERKAGAELVLTRSQASKTYEYTLQHVTTHININFIDIILLLPPSFLSTLFRKTGIRSIRVNRLVSLSRFFSLLFRFLQLPFFFCSLNDNVRSPTPLTVHRRTNRPLRIHIMIVININIYKLIST